MTKALTATLGALVALLIAGTGSPQAAERPVVLTEVMPYNIVNFGLSAYHLAHGVYPDNWAAVRQAGIVQVDLAIVGRGTINPDDGSIDFEGDVVYHGVAADGSCSLSLGPPRGEGIVDLPLISKYTLQPKDSSFSNMILQMDAAGERFEVSPQSMNLIAMADVLSSCLMIYKMYREGADFTWQEFLASGLSPIGASAVNPATGTPLSLAGGAYQLKVEAHKPVVRVLDNEGQAILIP